MQNLYDILGISKHSTEKDIREAYRKLAFKLHPDRGGNAEKFKEIVNAYEILKDEEKRRSYDNGTLENNNMFINKCNSIVVQINVSLEEFYNGDKIMKKISIDRICKKCQGNGCKDKNKMYKCKDCNGRGSKIIGQTIIQQICIECEKCHGNGKIYDQKYKCNICNGDKIIKREKKFNININSNSEKILHKNKGNEYPEFERGDILFVIVTKDHHKFTRIDKHNLYIKETINLAEALIGTKIIIEHLDKRKIYVDIDEIIKPNTVKRICGEGIPKNKGDLIIEFDIQFPEYVDKQLTTQLQEILSQKIIEKNINDCEKGFILDHKINDNDTDNNEGNIECNTQ
jgi:DnaJ family protein A protein 2